MNLKKSLNRLLILVVPFVFVSCGDRENIQTGAANSSVGNDTLTSFSIELVKRLDNQIEWSRSEFDSVTSKSANIHRPIYDMYDQRDFVESVKEIDLSRYFTKSELSRPAVRQVSPGAIERYGVVDGNTVRGWYEETERLQLENPDAVIPGSFDWYFSVTEPVLSANGNYIYLEVFESNPDKEAFWVYVFKKEKAGWKRFYVKRIGVKKE